MRIGHGYDTHRFGRDIPLILGGVNIPYEYGLQAHSDGDVVIHALCDALLGAAGLGDIGNHYPDTDPNLADIDSRTLLRDIVAKLQQRHYKIINADITIIAQAPKLAEHIDAMKTNLAADMAVTVSALNIKATTSEKMGFIGRQEGIAVHAVALIDEA
ncbi:MAG: 2-C-methyl-D-erythritol 2,4-cyclodiphosphate synthase [Gammaproteobacteria bacterium]